MFRWVSGWTGDGTGEGFREGNDGEDEDDEDRDDGGDAVHCSCEYHILCTASGTFSSIG